MNKLEACNSKLKGSLLEERTIPVFVAGDTLKVHVKISEGSTQRVQIFEGLCIARRNSSIGSTFTVMKISHLERVERVFHLYSPRIVKIEVVKRSIVRRAKLYYMRDRRGKAARIVEKNFYVKGEKKKQKLSVDKKVEVSEDKKLNDTHESNAVEKTNLDTENKKKKDE